MWPQAEEWSGTEKNSSLDSLGSWEYSPGDIWSFDLLKCDSMHFRCVKWLDLWSFVATAADNKYRFYCKRKISATSILSVGSLQQAMVLCILGLEPSVQIKNSVHWYGWQIGGFSSVSVPGQHCGGNAWLHSMDLSSALQPPSNSAIYWGPFNAPLSAPRTGLLSAV